MTAEVPEWDAAESARLRRSPRPPLAAQPLQLRPSKACKLRGGLTSSKSATLGLSRRGPKLCQKSSAGAKRALDGLIWGG